MSVAVDIDDSIALSGPLISITLPSIHPGPLARTIGNIEDTTLSEVEIIVVSNFSIPKLTRHRVVHLHETERFGPNAGHAFAAQYATGDFITAWVDDHIYVEGWDERATNEFVTREAKFQLSAPKVPRMERPFLLGLRHADRSIIGTVFGRYYPYFPFMRRIDAIRLGWLSGDYAVGFADCDLAMRVWDAGGMCAPTHAGIVKVHEDDDRKLPELVQEGHTLPEDMALFLHRWEARFGQGWDTKHLRGFNIDRPYIAETV